MSIFYQGLLIPAREYQANRFVTIRELFRESKKSIKKKGRPPQGTPL